MNKINTYDKFSKPDYERLLFLKMACLLPTKEN